MPQVFQVLRCYKCLVFQVHQVKKSNKWQCKLCGEKQSMKRNYGLGTGKECRLYVQKFNELRGEKNEQNICNIDSSDDFESSEETSKPYIKNIATTKTTSKWSNYIEKVESNETAYVQNEKLDGKEVVLELPKKRKKTFKKNYSNRKRKYSKNQSEDEDDEDDITCDTLNTDKVNFVSISKKQIKRFVPPTSKSANYTENLDINNTLPSSVKTNFEIITEEKNAYFKFRGDSFNSSSITTTTNSNACPEYNRTDNKSGVLNTVHEKKIVSTLKQNSKWAEFVDNTVIEDEQTENNEDFETTLYNGDNTKGTNMFSMCDDSELDSVLEI